MRVALCVHGTVGRIYTDKKNSMWTHDVDYRIGLEHYRKHLLAVNDIDVFIHCWDEQYQDGIIADYEPKSSIFEEQIIFDSENVRTNREKSRWYSQKQVVSLKKKYEEKNNFEYDYVMVARFDQAFMKDLKFSDYDNKMFWTPKSESTVAECMLKPHFLDYWFFSNSKNMDLFATLYDQWDMLQDWKKKNKTWPDFLAGPNAHVDSYVHANLLGLDIGYTFDEYTDHDLVRGIYKDCEHAGPNYKGIEKLHKFKEYPTERF